MATLKKNTVYFRFQGAKQCSWFWPVFLVLACIGCSDGKSNDDRSGEGESVVEQGHPAPTAPSSDETTSVVNDDSPMGDSHLGGALEELKNQMPDEAKTALENQVKNLSSGEVDQALDKLKQRSAEETKALGSDEQYDEIKGLINRN